MLLQATVRGYGQHRLEVVVKSLEVLDMRFDQLKSDLKLHKVRWIVLLDYSLPMLLFICSECNRRSCWI